jgi:hypothetical protein
MRKWFIHFEISELGQAKTMSVVVAMERVSVVVAMKREAVSDCFIHDIIRVMLHQEDDQ